MGPPGWEMGFGFGFGGMEIDAPASYMYGDGLHFSNHHAFPISSSSSAAAAHLQATPPDNAAHPQSGRSSFPDDLCYIPSCEEASELEWLSQFVEDSYSDIHYPVTVATDSLVAGGGTDPSKRSRTIFPTPNQLQTHVAGAWSTLAPNSQSSSPTASSSSSTSEFSTPQRKKQGGGRRRSGGGAEAGGRRCTHCASEKTPQWRTGPLGPKTLCNACGVRYKSGRLVPEYRPAASPTFVLTQHSNSHRKVMELRRQKEFLILRHDGGSAAGARPELLFHDYEVC